MSKQENRKVVVLGSRPGSGNIGSHVGLKFIAKGWDVREDDCHRLPRHGDLLGIPAYVSDDTVMDDADVMVCTLGYTKVGHFHRQTDQEIARTIYACLTLPLLAAKEYINQRMAALEGVSHPKGRVVFVGSYGHDHVLSHSEAYCAAKAGLAHAVRCLAWDYTKAGFHFSVVHPYHVPGTPMWQHVQEGVMEQNDWTRQQADAHAHRDTQLRRLVDPDEVADAVYDAATSGPWTSGAGVNLYGGVR